MAPASTAEILRPAQFKQSSRKGKRAWRKNINLGELENTQQSPNEATNEQPGTLFVVDAVGEHEAVRLPVKAARILHQDRVLGLSAAIPSVPSHKRSRDRTGTSLVTQFSKRIRANETLNTEVIHKNVLVGLPEEAPRLHRTTIRPPTQDLWNTSSQSQDSSDPSDFKPYSYSASLQYAKRVPRKTFDGYQKRTGTQPSTTESYNPTFDAWNAALLEHSKEAMKLDALQRGIAERDAAMMMRAANATEDLRVQLGEEASSSEEAEEDRLLQKSRIAKPPKRKTKAQRNRAERVKQQDNLLLHMKRMRIRRADESNIGGIARAIRRAEAQRRASSRHQPTSPEYAASLLDSWEKRHRKRSYV